MWFILHFHKITALILQASNGILFSINSQNVENNKKIYLSFSYAPANLTPLVCVHSHLPLFGGVGLKHTSSAVITS